MWRLCWRAVVYIWADSLVDSKANKQEKDNNKEMLWDDQDIFSKRLHASLCQMKSLARADGKEKSHASPVVELCKIAFSTDVWSHLKELNIASEHC